MQEETLQRIYIIKMFQLGTLLFSLLKIFRKAEDTVMNLEELAGSGFSDTEEVDCPESKVGGIFFKLVITDALVFSTIQHVRLYFTTTGFPVLWRWWSTVNKFEAWDSEVTGDPSGLTPNGFKLQCRIELREQGLTLEDRMDGIKLKIRKKKTWWKLVETGHGQHPHVARGQTILEKLKDIEKAQFRTNGIADEEALKIDLEFTQNFEHLSKVFKEHGIIKVGDLMAKMLNTDAIVKMLHGKKTGKSKAGHAVREIPLKHLHMICEELVESEGLWVDVTDRVNERRRYKLHPVKFSNFISASLMIDVLYRQTFVWVGATFCPWLPVIACLAQTSMFWSLKESMLNGGYRRPSEPWSAEKTFKVFMMLALLTLLITVAPVIMWLNTTPQVRASAHSRVRTSVAITTSSC